MKRSVRCKFYDVPLSRPRVSEEVRRDAKFVDLTNYIWESLKKAMENIWTLIPENGDVDLKALEATFDIKGLVESLSEWAVNMFDKVVSKINGTSGRKEADVSPDAEEQPQPLGSYRVPAALSMTTT